MAKKLARLIELEGRVGDNPEAAYQAALCQR